MRQINVDEKAELIRQVRKAVRKEVGSAIHFGQGITEDSLFLCAARTAYYYLAENTIPIEASPEWMLKSLEREVGLGKVTVLSVEPNAVRFRLQKREWWFRLRNVNTVKECLCIGISDDPQHTFSVVWHPEQILPQIDKLSDELLAVAKDEKKKLLPVQ